MPSRSHFGWEMKRRKKSNHYRIKRVSRSRTHALKYTRKDLEGFLNLSREGDGVQISISIAWSSLNIFSF